jgi:nidogen-like/Regulator of Chromosome Condensation (RCC1) repeat protein/somatomedin B domain-containing protein
MKWSSRATITSRKGPRPGRPRQLVATAAAAAHLLLATPARADALVDAAGCTANTLPRGNEALGGPVDLGFEVTFGGAPYSQIYVDTNGAVRFAGNTLGFGALRGASWTTPPSHGVPFVAPFHADVDTSGPTSGAVTYGRIPQYAEGRKAFCVTWGEVESEAGGGSSENAGLRNAFQLVLVERPEPGAFDVVFNYRRLDWETSGHPPFVGYFDGRHEVELPGSRVARALLDANSNGLVYGQRGGDEVGRYVLPVVEAAAPPVVRAQLTGKALGPDGQALVGAAVRACDSRGLCVTGVTGASGVYTLRGFEGADIADLWKVELAAPPSADVEPPAAVFFSFPSVATPVASVVDAVLSPPSSPSAGSCGDANGTLFCGGASADGCSCADGCELAGTCCPDKAGLCDLPAGSGGAGGGGGVGGAAGNAGSGGAPSGDSCLTRCGDYNATAACQCDVTCAQLGDCCPDKLDVCGGEGGSAGEGGSVGAAGEAGAGAGGTAGTSGAGGEAGADAGGSAGISGGGGTDGGTSGPLVSQVVAGGWHSCVIVDGGRVQCWGRNDEGQLGDGTTEDRLTPVSVLQSPGGPPLSGAQALALGTHSCVLLSGSEVRCWGGNWAGQLGDGTQAHRLTPVAVLQSSGGPPLSGVQALVIGYDHGCARLSSSDLRCWGWNHYGQLGDGTTTDRLTPVSVQFDAGNEPGGSGGISGSDGTGGSGDSGGAGAGGAAGAAGDAGAGGHAGAGGNGGEGGSAAGAGGSGEAGAGAGGGQGGVGAAGAGGQGGAGAGASGGTGGVPQSSQCGCSDTGDYVAAERVAPRRDPKPTDSFRLVVPNVGSQTLQPIAVHRNSDNAVVYNGHIPNFHVGSSIGLDPSGNRLVYSFANSPTNPSQRMLAVVDLTAATPTAITRVFNVAGAAFDLSFSPSGTFLAMATPSSAAPELTLTVADLREGPALFAQPYVDTFRAVLPADVNLDTVGDATWGFNRRDGNALVYAYRTTNQKPISWTLVSLKAFKNAQLPGQGKRSRQLGLGSSWAFSPCGDTIGLLEPRPFDKLAEVFSTSDVQARGSRTSPANATVSFRSVPPAPPVLSKHQIVENGNPVVAIDNGAAKACLSTPFPSAVVPGADSVVGGTAPFGGTVVLNGPAPAGGVVVELQAQSSPTPDLPPGTVVASVPATVIVPAGEMAVRGAQRAA